MSYREMVELLEEIYREGAMVAKDILIAGMIGTAVCSVIAEEGPATTIPQFKAQLVKIAGRLDIMIIEARSWF